MANRTYNDHAEDTSFGASDFIPFWKTSASAARKIGRANLITSLKESRVTSIASSATPQPNIDTTDTYLITALAQNASILAPSGTPSDAQKLIIRIRDNGAGRTLSWASIYRGIGQNLPSATTAGKLMYMGFIYNSTDNKWDMVAYSQEL
jgi:hypothetical protein